MNINYLPMEAIIEIVGYYPKNDNNIKNIFLISKKWNQYANQYNKLIINCISEKYKTFNIESIPVHFSDKEKQEKYKKLFNAKPIDRIIRELDIRKNRHFVNQMSWTPFNIININDRGNYVLFYDIFPAVSSRLSNKNIDNIIALLIKPVLIENIELEESENELEESKNLKIKKNEDQKQIAKERLVNIYTFKKITKNQYDVFAYDPREEEQTKQISDEYDNLRFESDEIEIEITRENSIKVERDYIITPKIELYQIILIINELDNFQFDIGQRYKPAGNLNIYY